ncbi:MAG: EamA family transporter [Thermoanaerobaculia bacterium]
MPDKLVSDGNRKADMVPRALLLTAVVIWGWTFVATKILLAELGPVEVFALRLAVGLPFLGLVLLVKRVPLRFARADVRPLLLGSGLVLAGVYRGQRERQA